MPEQLSVRNFEVSLVWSIGSRAACSNDFKSWGCESFEACKVEVSRCEGASFEVFGGRRRFRLWPLLGTFAPEASRYINDHRREHDSSYCVNIHNGSSLGIFMKTTNNAVPSTFT